jgi:ParB-like chromosome segregation protein Spo0J
MEKLDNAIEPKGLADGIPVYCEFSEIVEINRISPNPRNPNKHPKKQIKLLAKIIQNQGWRTPIAVSIQTGFVVRGHGRMMAALMLGVSEVPVDWQSYKNGAEEYADLVADNKISELSMIDNNTLKDLLQELDTGSFDMDLTGFDASELENLMTQFNVVAPPEEKKKEPKICTCPKCGYEFEEK